MSDPDPEDATADGDQLTAPQPEAPAVETAAEDVADTDVGGDRRADDEEVPPSWTEELEEGAASFVELEDALSGDGPEPDRARVVGAETVPTDEVPGDYPRRIDTDRALALRLAVGDPDGPATAYFPWPTTGDDALGRLLAALSISRDSFADLNGRRLLVTVEDGYVLPIVPRTEPRGSQHGLLGILGVQAVNLALLAGALVLGSTISLPFWAFLVLNVLVLPVATFLDARHLESTTDWSQGPGFWALLQALPWLNVLVTAAYLWFRRRARPLDDR